MKHGKTWTNQAEEQLVVFMIPLIANKMCEFAVVEPFDRLRIPPVETTVMQTYWTAPTKFVKPLFKVLNILNFRELSSKVPVFLFFPVSRHKENNESIQFKTPRNHCKRIPPFDKCRQPSVIAGRIKFSKGRTNISYH